MHAYKNHSELPEWVRDYIKTVTGQKVESIALSEINTFMNESEEFLSNVGQESA